MSSGLIPEPHECEVSRADLEDLRREKDDDIQALREEIDDLRRDLEGGLP